MNIALDAAKAVEGKYIRMSPGHLHIFQLLYKKAQSVVYEY